MYRYIVFQKNTCIRIGMLHVFVVVVVVVVVVVTGGTVGSIFRAERELNGIVW